MARELRPPRIFVGPIEIAGYYTRLAANLREIGVDAVAVDVSGHPFHYERGPRNSIWIRLAEAAGRFDARFRSRSMALRIPVRVVAIAARVPLFLWALRRFDVFVFGFGHSFFYTRELPILKAARKTMIFVFNGSDARPPFVDGAQMRRSRRRTVSDCIQMTKRQKARIKRIEQYAAAVVSQPAFSHFFERPVVDFFRIGHPWTEVAVDDASVDAASAAAGQVRILHSPSDPEVKGSDRIRAAVTSLIDSGEQLELIEIRGASNQKVREEIERCDFVIDQIYSDAPMVGFATEAAASGKPAIVGGYAWPELNRIYPGEHMPPVEQCRPEELESAILKLAGDVAYRRELGQAARRFVHEAWARPRIAERYLALIEGRLGAEFFFDPNTLTYVQGVGFDERHARSLVASVLELGGRSVLELADKPALERRFVEFAAGTSRTG